MKYDSSRKIERNRRIVECRAEHPDWSWQEIADRFPPLSRQRCCAIYKRTTETDLLRT